MPTQGKTLYSAVMTRLRNSGRTTGGACRRWGLACLYLCWFVTAHPAGGLDGVSPSVVAPGLRLQALDGTERDLSDLRGKVVLVNFWATWCMPCVREMPSLERLYRERRDRGFLVLAVNVAEPKRRLQAYVERQGLSFPVLLDPDSRAFHAWGVKAIPTSLLVDTAGRVRYRGLGELGWDDDAVRGLIDALLTEATP